MRLGNRNFATRSDQLTPLDAVLVDGPRSRGQEKGLIVDAFSMKGKRKRDENKTKRASGDASLTCTGGSALGADRRATPATSEFLSQHFPPFLLDTLPCASSRVLEARWCSERIKA